MIKGVFKAGELIEKLQQMQPDEDVALYLVDQNDVHKWDTRGGDEIMSMDLGSFAEVRRGHGQMDRRGRRVRPDPDVR